MERESLLCVKPLEGELKKRNNIVDVYAASRKFVKYAMHYE